MNFHTSGTFVVRSVWVCPMAESCQTTVVNLIIEEFLKKSDQTGKFNPQEKTIFCFLDLFSQLEENCK